MCFFLHNQRWFETTERRRQVIDWAYQLDRAYPQQRLVAVGQSAAWMVSLAGYIREQQGRPNHTAIIPFSGKFLRRERDAARKYPENMWLPHFSPMQGGRGHGLWPRGLPMKDYFNHIASSGAGPDQAIDAARGGLRTVFVDMGETFEGVASFAALYLQESDRRGVLEEAMQSISFHLYDSYNTLPEGRISITDDRGCVYDCPVAVQGLSPEERMTIAMVADSNALNEKSSRLADYYNLTEREPYPKKADNAALVERIRTVLQDEVRARLNTDAGISPPRP